MSSMNVGEKEAYLHVPQPVLTLGRKGRFLLIGCIEALSRFTIEQWLSLVGSEMYLADTE
jgi:hypothetical protein